MSELPPISVVIPCFNGARYIAGTIRSVLSQAWPKIEIIVVDDGSRDDSAQLVQDSFPSVKLIRQANQGVAAARNAGIRAAGSDWLAFVDADDIWLEGKLEHQWLQLQAHPGVRMNYTAWEVWPSEEQVPSDHIVERLRSTADDKRWGGASGWLYAALLLDCVVWTSTVLVHRSVIDEVGDFDTSLRIGEDYDLWLRASRVTQILRVARPLALYRSHTASITKSVPSQNHQGVVIQRALDRWALASPDGSSARASDVYGVLARTWSDFAAANLCAGRSSQAWTAGMHSIKTRWREPGGWKVLAKVITQSWRARQ